MDLIEWLFVLLCIGSVIALEIVNTCIEKLCDLISIEKCNEIKEIKDMAASAVFVVSIVSLCIAILILFRHLGG